MNLLKSMSVYFVGSLINAAIPFLLLPWFTRCLSPGDFGMLSLVQVFAAVLFPLVIVGVHASVNTQYFQRGPGADLSSYLSSALLIPVLAAAVVSVALLAAAGRLQAMTGVDPFWMKACVLLGLLQVLPTVVLYLLQASQKPMLYASFQIGMTIVNFGLSLFLLVQRHMNWEGRMYGLLVTYALATGVGAVWLRHRGYLTASIRLDHFREAFRFGFFLIPHEVGGIALQMANRLIINLFVGVAGLGLYSVAAQVGSIIAFIAMAFNQAWIPYLFGRLGETVPGRSERLVRLSYGLFAGFLALAGAMGVGAHLVFRFFINQRFAGAEPLVFWVALSFAFTGMYFVVVNYIVYEKKTHLLAYITLSCGAVSLGLTFLLTRSYGLLAAVKAQALGNLIFFLATWVFSARVHPMPWLGVFRQSRPASR